MKIAVYGDSFTVEFDQTRPWAWFNLLASKMNGRVENDHILDSSYGIGGASTFYSYKKFLESHERYDYVFFVAGDPYRYTRPFQKNNGLVFIPNMPTIDHHINADSSTYYFKEYLHKLRNWFEVADTEYQEMTQQLIIEDIRNKMGGRALILPANDKSFTKEQKERLNIGDFTLTDYCRVIWKSLKIPKDKLVSITGDERKDKIACHFTEEASIQLADLLNYYIQNPNTILNLPEHIEHKETWNYYYE
jgi:hypothetical protein